MPGSEVLVFAMSLSFLVLVPVLVAVQFRQRRGRWPLVGLSAATYWLVMTVLSRVLLLGLVYPRVPARSGLTLHQLEIRFVLHTAVCGSAAALATILLFAWLRRLVPRDSDPAVVG